MIRSLLRLCPCLALVLSLAALASPAQAVSPPAYITQWGTFGSGPGQFKQPAGVATDGAGFVYVADTGNNRVQKFTTAGAFVSFCRKYTSGAERACRWIVGKLVRMNRNISS